MGIILIILCFFTYSYLFAGIEPKHILRRVLSSVLKRQIAESTRILYFLLFLSYSRISLIIIKPNVFK